MLRTHGMTSVIGKKNLRKIFVGYRSVRFNMKKNKKKPVNKVNVHDELMRKVKKALKNAEKLMTDLRRL